MSEPTTEAGKRLLADILELAEAFHQTGSIRDHADPKDWTGWNVHGIETCEDVYCVDALAADKDIRAIEAEAVTPERARIRAAVEGLAILDYSVVTYVDGGKGKPVPYMAEEDYYVKRAAVLRIIDGSKPASTKPVSTRDADRTASHPDSPERDPSVDRA